MKPHLHFICSLPLIACLVLGVSLLLRSEPDAELQEYRSEWKPENWTVDPTLAARTR